MACNENDHGFNEKGICVFCGKTEEFNEEKYLENQLEWLTNNDHSLMSEQSINQIENRLKELRGKK